MRSGILANISLYGKNETRLVLNVCRGHVDDTNTRKRKGKEKNFKEKQKECYYLLGTMIRTTTMKNDLQE